MVTAIERRYRALGYRFKVEASTGVVDAELHRHLVPLIDDGDAACDMPLYRLSLVDGDYVATAGERRLAQHPDPALAATELLWRITHEAIPTINDRLAFHAGAVSIDGSGVMLPADSGSGKSTLVAGLVFRGADYLSDEVAALEGPVLQPFPRPLSLKPNSIPVLEALGCRLSPSVLADLDLGQRFVAPDDLRPGAVGDACPLNLVVFPTYQPGADLAIEPMSRAEGVMTMIRNCFNFSALGAERLQSLGEAARNARFYRLLSGDLSAAADAVRSLARESST